MNEIKFDPKDPDNYDHWVEDNIRFCDQDGSGHVNNTAIAQYVESGRVGYNRDLLLPHLAGSRFVAARVAIDYLKEAYYPGRVRTGTRVSRVGNKSVTTLCGVFIDDACIATAECVIVHMVGANTEPLTGEMRQVLDADLL